MEKETSQLVRLLLGSVLLIGGLINIGLGIAKGFLEGINTFSDLLTPSFALFTGILILFAGLFTLKDVLSECREEEI